MRSIKLATLLALDQLRERLQMRRISFYMDSWLSWYVGPHLSQQFLACFQLVHHQTNLAFSIVFLHQFSPPPELPWDTMEEKDCEFIIIWLRKLLLHFISNWKLMIDLLLIEIISLSVRPFFFTTIPGAAEANGAIAKQVSVNSHRTIPWQMTAEN